jgi:hypothetical protein
MAAHDPTVYTLLLTLMCLGLLVFTLAQLLLSMRNKNKLLSWSTCFYVLCLLWTVVRSTYWIMIQTRESMTYLELYLLYWVPTPIQYVPCRRVPWAGALTALSCRFANFSLLILFYIQVITGKKWRTRWRSVCLPLYLVLTMAMTTFTAVWAFNSSNDISYATEHGDHYDQEFYQVSAVSVQLEYSAISFFLLSFLFGVFGWKMANVSSSPSLSLFRRIPSRRSCFLSSRAGGERQAPADAHLPASRTTSSVAQIFRVLPVQSLTCCAL